MERLSPEDDELLCRAILALRDPADCRRFFADLCTIQELHDLAQRVRVARMLMDQANYKEISRATGIMATIRMMQGMLRKKLTTKPSTQLMMRQAICFPFPT